VASIDAEASVHIPSAAEGFKLAREKGRGPLKGYFNAALGLYLDAGLQVGAQRTRVSGHFGSNRRVPRKSDELPQAHGPIEVVGPRVGRALDAKVAGIFHDLGRISDVWEALGPEHIEAFVAPPNGPARKFDGGAAAAGSSGHLA